MRNEYEVKLQLKKSCQNEVQEELLRSKITREESLIRQAALIFLKELQNEDKELQEELDMHSGNHPALFEIMKKLSDSIIK